MSAFRVVLNYGPDAPLHADLARDDRAMSGIRTSAVALCKTLARRGHDVHLFARCPKPGRVDGVLWHDRSDFAEFARQHSVDALVAVPPALPLLMPLRARARVVWSGNAYESGDTLLAVKYPWAPHIGRAGMRARLFSLARLQSCVDRYVVKSQWQSDYLRDAHRIAANKLCVIYNGVPLERYRGPAPPRHRHRLVYTSQARRGLDVLLAVFPQVREAVGSAELHVFGYEYGASDAMPEIPDLAAAQQPGVVWRGRVDKQTLAYELRSASLMAYPCTLNETFCTAVAEAQAAGLPVVTSDFAALSERVTHGVDGFLIGGRADKPKYQVPFVDAIIRLLRDDELWRRMGAVAARKAHRAYDWEGIAVRWEDEMRGLTDGKHPQPPPFDDSLDLLTPAMRRVSDHGAAAEIPAPLAARWFRKAWAAYGFGTETIPEPRLKAAASESGKDPAGVRS